MKKIKVAVNGLGRIGRAFVRQAIKRPQEIELVAFNDLIDIENLAYLLRYDSAYGLADFKIEVKDEKFIIDDQVIPFYSEPEPGQLPWGDLEVDIVVEATGFFTEYKKAKDHLTAGARRVVITAPAKGEPVPGVETATVLMGVNNHDLATCQISSNASCTTNAVSPVVQILKESIGIKKAMLNTVHGYTVSQGIVDGPDKKDWRRGRAGAANIVPSSTGAAKAVTEVLTDLENKFDGIALRVPVLVGSIADLTMVTTRETTTEEVNNILIEASQTERWKKVLAVTDESLVSSDIIGRNEAAIVDLQMTRVVDGDLVKILSWYDNEAGYTGALVEHIITAGRA
ncbi:MAG: type I glyceraldehyde-3-phosphate dehydrogenase [Patescibacteria group bacterium]